MGEVVKGHFIQSDKTNGLFDYGHNLRRGQTALNSLLDDQMAGSHCIVLPRRLHSIAFAPLELTGPFQSSCYANHSANQLYWANIPTSRNCCRSELFFSVCYNNNIFSGHHCIVIGVFSIVLLIWTITINALNVFSIDFDGFSMVFPNSGAMENNGFGCEKSNHNHDNCHFKSISEVS